MTDDTPRACLKASLHQTTGAAHCLTPSAAAPSCYPGRCTILRNRRHRSRVPYGPTSRIAPLCPSCPIPSLPLSHRLSPEAAHRPTATLTSALNSPPRCVVCRRLLTVSFPP
eukprot:EG_transcript_37899